MWVGFLVLSLLCLVVWGCWFSWFFVLQFVLLYLTCVDVVDLLAVVYVVDCAFFSCLCLTGWYFDVLDFLELHVLLTRFCFGFLLSDA